MFSISAAEFIRWLTGLALGLALMAVWACQPSQPRIRVEGAWVRITVDRGAAYMVITNDGGADDVLVGASSPVAGSVSLHQTVMKEEGVMGMEPVPRLKLPAGGRVELKPLSYHLMMTDLKEDLTPGQKVRIVLHFEKSGDVGVEAEVRRP